ncbi:YggS family pyridoxal phosphate-dependent enzyme [Marinospirillum perlucidum]|uniref:YggS family pyridoxal phosphate-dependent enzyme n=1 Tax=Marinospirillum perlucidum TaxID=1982602 RepID=UPI000DF254AE|nr:YggS family pyridoxal phosphate-dependent enzyme [Marinospirillum perlucidum]
MLQSVIAQHIAKVRQQVEQACHKFERNPAQVKILAVSKKQSSQAIREAAAEGQQAFGENYLQEALQKQEELGDLDLEWHFIGPIQSNKTRDLASHFNWVHTLDRFKVARRLNDQRPEELEPLKVLIQVNISDEQSKSGIAPADLLALADQIMQLPRLELRGLMCIPAASDDVSEQRKTFAQMAALFKRLQEAYPQAQIDTLSMGMSGDLEAAIAEGSSLVRIGTAIFGARN